MKPGFKFVWLILILLFLPGIIFAFQPKNYKNDLTEKEFFLPELYIGNKAVPRAEIDSQLANKDALNAFNGKYSGTVMWFDPRSGHPMSIIGAIPIIPGKGAGNHLTVESISHQLGKQVTEINTQVVGELFRNFVIKNKAAIGIDVSQLGPVNAVQINDRLWNINIPQVVNGIPVRWSRYMGTINSGNIVVQGAATWGNVRINTTPSITAFQSVELGLNFVGGRLANDRIWKEPSLEILPLAPPAFAIGEHGFSGKVGQGYGHRLAWVFGFQRAPESARWEVAVDAHTAEILSFEDKNHYVSKQIKGGIYPLTNTEICPDNVRCGVLQDDHPMPFTNTGFAAPNNFTNSAGIFEYTSGTTTTNLTGPYVSITDTCSNHSGTGLGDINLGGVNGDHDCDFGAGNTTTAAARSGMYEVNKIFEAGRGYLPNNAWLQGNQGGPLPTNMNINQSCNAFYTSGNPGTINFYRELGGCRNTGEIAAVFDHEWGHGMDDHDANGGLSISSEGYADIASMMRLWASCVGYGFFKTINSGCGQTADGTGFNQDEAQQGSAVCDLDCSGVRDADYTKIANGTPLTAQFVCASCANVGGGPCGRQVHCAATPTREAAWNLAARELQNPPNTDVDGNTAFIIADKLFYQGAGNVGLWHNCTCPTTSDGCNADSGYLQYLAADDDNGNLTDGTPHMVDIFAAYNTNNIACPNPAPTQSGCGGGPITPPVVVASPGSNAASLSWGAVTNATKYNIYRTEGYAGCSFGKALVGSVNSPLTTFTDTEVANGREYWYVVMAEGANDACFTDASNCVNVTPQPCAGAVSLDASVYSCSDTVNITVVDSDLTGAGSINVNVTSTTETTPEVITLTETPASSGNFVGSIGTTSAPPADDGLLSTVHNDTISVTYHDDSFCGPPQDVTATASTDCLAVLNHVQSSFSDSCSQGGAGDDDGILDPGETAVLQVTAQNTSITDATGVTATLSTTTPGVTITDNTATFPTIPAGGSATSDAPHFTFTVSSGITCATFIDFTIDYQTNEGNSSDNFTVLVGQNTIQTNNYSSTDVPKAITDLSTISSTVNVGDAGPINDVDVSLTLLHTADGDLDISLIGPNGSTEVNLSSDNGGTGNDYTGTKFDDDSGPSITTGTPPFTGTFRPEGLLSTYDTTEKSGTWTLKIVDDTAANTGNLISWGLTIKEDTAVCNVCGAACPTITLSPSTLSNGTEGIAYNQTITPSGGAGPYTFAVSIGALPDGLTLDANTGVISGTPTVVNTFNFTVTATDSNNCTGSQAYSITIDAAGSSLYVNEFDDGVLATDWTYSPNSNPWSEANGAKTGSTLKKTTAVASPAFSQGCLNCYVETVVRTTGGIGGQVSLFHHFVDKKNLVELIINEEKNKLILKRKVNNSVVAKQNFKTPIEPNTDYVVRITFDGTNYIVSVDGTPVITMPPGGQATAGTAGFKVKATSASYDRIEVK
jgi:subtilisin-like proprotein convertase family protein